MKTRWTPSRLREASGPETGSRGSGKEHQEGRSRIGRLHPFIVLDDADIEKRPDGGESRTLNTGQSCIAAKRFIVLRQAAGEFQRLFVKYLEELKSAIPWTMHGPWPLSRNDILVNLEEQLRDAGKRVHRSSSGTTLFKRVFLFARRSSRSRKT